MKSALEWKRVTEGLSPYAVALTVLDDLKGYRKTSLDRAEDSDNLTNLVRALTEGEETT